MGGVDGLEHAGERTAALWHAHSLRRGRDIGHVVAQGLEQALDAVVMRRRAEQHRHDQVAFEIAPDIGEYVLGGGHHVGQKLFEQPVVEIGKMFEHLLARRLLLRERRLGQLDQFGGLVGAIFVGALADQIDIAGDGIAALDRQFAQQQRPLRNALQCFERFAQTRLAGFDLVDEDDVRDAPRIQKFKNRRRHYRAAWLGLDHHHGGVGHHERMETVLLELDRTRAIEKAPAIVEERAVGDIDLDAHGAVARLG